MNRRRIMRLLIVPAAMLAAGGAFAALLFLARAEPQRAPPQRAAPLVETVTLQPQRVRFTVQAQGTVAPRAESALAPQIAGEVVWVSPNLVSGGFFEAGEVLVRLDSADARAAVARAKAALARAESEAAHAARQRARQQELARSGIASAARLDAAETAHAQAQAALREAEVALASARRELSRTKLRAPYAGRVRSESVDAGQFVKRGDPVAKLYAIDYAEVRLPVPDGELRYLNAPLMARPENASAAAQTSTGPEVLLKADFAGSAHTWRGRIVRSEGEIDPRSRMVTLVARVENPYAASAARPPLAVGLFVRAEILGREESAAFVLPRAALREDGRLMVVQGGRLQFRRAQVLRVERERVIVGGLRAGERVCITPLAQAINGMAVQVANESTAAAAAAGAKP